MACVIHYWKALKILFHIYHNERNIYCSATLSFLHALSAWYSRAPISTDFYLAKKLVEMGANNLLKKRSALIEQISCNIPIKIWITLSASLHYVHFIFQDDFGAHSIPILSFAHSFEENFPKSGLFTQSAHSIQITNRCVDNSRCIV